MGFELLLLCALIFIFLISFCGLIQKIKQSYERERLIADRVIRRQAQASLPRHLLTDDYVNSGFMPESDSGIFPSSPPPYSQICPPPKYDDIIKDRSPEIIVSNASTDQIRPTGPSPPSAPPPYTVSIV